jgi:pyrroline-5-carboxylate reductase
MSNEVTTAREQGKAMAEKTVGFVGGGRVTRIILGGLQKAGCMPSRVVVSDVHPDVLKHLRAGFPSVQAALNNNQEAAGQDLVFLGLHPPTLAGALGEIRDSLKAGATVVSLAPKLTIARLTEALGGFDRIVRFIPNAASIIGQGYNPIAFSQALGRQDREEIKSLLRALGKNPEVAEDKLEAYAVIIAMGPTYLWFQLHELHTMAESFGLTAEETVTGLTEMVKGAVKTLFGSGMSVQEVIDLVPVKPLGEDEAAIRAAYRARLEPLYRKLKN